ncbi:MAG: hypothetical protein HQ521_06670 [Bacteroidetes bacterium]|nr:hypothetical protein [Bacteroidota bacterium]
MSLEQDLKIKEMYEKSPQDVWKSQNYFCLEELTPKDIFTQMGENSLELFSGFLIYTIIELRELFGYPITANNWKWSGLLQYRGFRPSSFYDGVSYSQHLYGNALDFDVKGKTAWEARDCITRWKSQGKLRFLTGMEIGEKVNWVHIDCRLSCNPGENGLFLFKP